MSRGVEIDYTTFRALAGIGARISRSFAYSAMLRKNGTHFARTGEVRRGTPANVLRWIDLAMEFGR